LTYDEQPYAALVCRLMTSTAIIHGLLLIYQPQRDGRLSWPGWLTHSKYFSCHMSTIDQLHTHSNTAAVGSHLASAHMHLSDLSEL